MNWVLKLFKLSENQKGAFMRSFFYLIAFFNISLISAMEVEVKEVQNKFFFHKKFEYHYLINKNNNETTDFFTEAFLLFNSRIKILSDKKKKLSNYFTIISHFSLQGSITPFTIKNNTDDDKHQVLTLDMRSYEKDIIPQIKAPFLKEIEELKQQIQNHQKELEKLSKKQISVAKLNKITDGQELVPSTDPTKKSIDAFHTKESKKNFFQCHPYSIPFTTLCIGIVGTFSYMKYSSLLWGK